MTKCIICGKEYIDIHSPIMRLAFLQHMTCSPKCDMEVQKLFCAVIVGGTLIKVLKDKKIIK